MRLIDVQSHELKEFFSDIPPYAILSHTWGDEEVTFQEYLLATGDEAINHSQIREKAGFSKILGACWRAKADGLQYLWCDTNCIDKKSSAELSEAINSMYTWYHDSVVCYAYLADVDTGTGVHVGHGDILAPVSFAKSRWFTRGWTLQELLAPKKVAFFDHRWRILGDRGGLADTISKITRIHIGALHDRNTVPEYSVAQRMSWAAGRVTTREEDIAYCLLGIFDVNMPLLYGEGHRAFERLQLEIIKISDDQSLLAWDNVSRNTGPWTGALAQSPEAFSACGSIVRDDEIGRTPYSRTNLGISVTFSMIRTVDGLVFLAALNCSHELRELGMTQTGPRTTPQRKTRSQVWIFLRYSGHGRYLRCHVPVSKLLLHDSYPDMVRGSTKTIFLILRNESGAYTMPHSELRLGRNPWLYCSGFRLAIGWGKMNPQHGIFTEAHIPCKVYERTLKSRSPSALSHELIATEKFSTILSMEWDERLRPRQWLYTTLHSREAAIIKHMSATNDWPWLFGASSCPGDESAFRRVSTVAKAHKLIRDSFKEYLPNPDNSATPLILERSKSSDLHGLVEVLVEVIIRDIPDQMIGHWAKEGDQNTHNGGPGSQRSKS